MPLLKVRPRSINVDFPPDEVGPDAWTFGKNIIMGNDSTQSALGATRVMGTPLERPLWGQTVAIAAPKVQYAGGAGLYATDGVTHTNITPAGGFGATAQGFFTGGMFNGLAIANDGARRPCYWNGALASLALTLPGFPSGDRAAACRPFKYYLVCVGGVVDGVDNPYGVRWSTSAAPGQPPASWAPLPTNDAGYVTLAGAREPLLDAAPLRDGLMIFEAHGAWMLGFIGGAYTFSNRRVLANAGIISPNAWAALGAELVVLTDGDLIITDGNTARSLLVKRMQRAIFSRLNLGARKACWVTVSSTRKQVIVGFPTGTNEYADTALVWNFGTDDFGLIDLPGYSHAFPSYNQGAPAGAWDQDALSWDSDLTVWDSGGYISLDSYIVGCRPGFGATGAFQATNQTESPDDGPLEVIASKEKMALESPDRIKHVTRIYPKVQGPAGVEMFWRVGMAAEPGQPTSWGPEQSFIIGQSEKIDVRETGRYVGVQVRSVTPRRWALSGFDIEYQMAGGR